VLHCWPLVEPVQAALFLSKHWGIALDEAICQPEQIVGIFKKHLSGFIVAGNEYRLPIMIRRDMNPTVMPGALGHL